MLKSFKREMNKETINKWLSMAIECLIIVVLLLLAVNQYYDWHYHNRFLQTPCGLCFELNPDVQNAFKEKYNPSTEDLKETYLNSMNINYTQLNEAMKP